MNVSEIQNTVKFEGYLLVREAIIRQTSMNKNFLDITLSDRSGAINGKVWNYDLAPPDAGTIVYVVGCGDEFNGKTQLKIERLRAAVESDNVSVSDFVPAAPEDPRVMYDELAQTVTAIQNKSIRDIVTAMLQDAYENKLLSFPAAKQMHHAEYAGLLHHTVTMLRAAKALCTVYNRLNKDLLFAGIIIHDLGKIKEMLLDVAGMIKEYSIQGKLIGHITLCVCDIEKIGEKVGAEREAIMLLQHLVLSHHGNYEFGSPVLPRIPEAEVLSVLDRLDAQLFQIWDNLDKIKQGEFTQGIWALNQREFYKS